MKGGGGGDLKTLNAVEESQPEDVGLEEGEGGAGREVRQAPSAPFIEHFPGGEIRVTVHLAEDVRESVERVMEKMVPESPRLAGHDDALVDDVLSDVVCTGRFYDFFEKRDGRWAIVRRQPIYEKDRLDPVDPSAELKLNADLLSKFPEGYRHLAYLQSKNGFLVKLDLPGLRGPAVEKLYAEGKSWLSGALRPGEPL